jgi:RND family efflux transporter MFP subunit
MTPRSEGGAQRWPLVAGSAGAWATGALGVRTPEVRTVSPTLGALEESVIADGVLSYRSEVALTSEVLGAVASIEAAEGQQVARGQVLMRLDAAQIAAQRTQRDENLQAAIASLQARAAERDIAAARLKRYRTLRADQLVSAEALEEAQLAARQSEAAYRETGHRIEAQRGELAETEERLRKTAIRSPIDGTVLSIDIAPGETAVPSTLSFSGSTVARIADTSRLNATARLGEFDVWKLAPGAPARVIVPALDDATLPGRVRSVALAPNAGAAAQNASLAASYEVVVDIEGRVHPGLRTGMACRIEFPRGDGTPRMTLPMDAIRTDPAGNTARGLVYVVEGERVAQREVVMGASAGGRREIVRGLERNARVILPPRGAASPAAGTRVRVVDTAGK